jgi:hypothetical protein
MKQRLNESKRGVLTELGTLRDTNHEDAQIFNIAHGIFSEVPTKLHRSTAWKTITLTLDLLLMTFILQLI